MSYRPAPRDTSAVELPRPIRDLTDDREEHPRELGAQRWTRLALGREARRPQDIRAWCPTRAVGIGEDYDRRTAIEP